MSRFRAFCLFGSSMSAVQGFRSFTLAHEDKAASRPTLSVYLNTESKATLEALLPKIGVMGEDIVPPQRVVLKSRMDEVDHYVYSPIYGERVAFRLQGWYGVKGDCGYRKTFKHARRRCTRITSRRASSWV